jgi:hypothetical protein
MPNSDPQNNKMQDKDPKKMGKVEKLLSFYALGIMSHFSDILNDNRGGLPNVEKRRVLRAVVEMLRIGKSSIRSALPQVSFLLLFLRCIANNEDMCLFTGRTGQ